MSSPFYERSILSTGATVPALNESRARTPDNPTSPVLTFCFCSDMSSEWLARPRHCRISEGSKARCGSRAARAALAPPTGRVRIKWLMHEPSAISHRRPCEWPSSESVGRPMFLPAHQITGRTRFLNCRFHEAAPKAHANLLLVLGSRTAMRLASP